MAESAINRRQLLAGSSALVLGGAVRAGDGEAPVRVAVVGTGARGSDLIRTLTTIEGARVVGVCDDYEPHLARGKEYAGPGAKAFADYGLMLRQTRPDAVVVATPLHLHFEMCQQALEAGCAVFCEKTMCRTVEQARRLAELVRERRAVFQVGLQRRANAVYRQALAMIETGMLGQVTAVKCQWHRNGSWRRPVPVRRDDPAWKALEQRLNWRLYDASSAGLPAELGSHQLDVVAWLLGAPPRRVLASGGIDYWRDGREVCDNVFCVYEHELKPAQGKPYTVRVTWSSIQTNAYEGASELVMGTKGTLFLTQKKGLFFREGAAEPVRSEGRADEEAALVTSGKTLKMNNDPWAHRGKPYEIDAHGDDTRDELIAFLDCAARRDPATPCDARLGLQNAITVLATNEAIREARPVELAFS